MKINQLNRGHTRRVMSVENKDGHLDGVVAHVGWVEFSKTGLMVYYRGRKLKRSSGIRGNHIDTETGDEYWISGIKKNGSNTHWAEQVKVTIDDDAKDEYLKIKNG